MHNGKQKMLIIKLLNIKKYEKNLELDLLKKMVDILQVGETPTSNQVKLTQLFQQLKKKSKTLFDSGIIEIYQIQHDKLLQMVQQN